MCIALNHNKVDKPRLKNTSSRILPHEIVEERDEIHRPLREQTPSGLVGAPPLVTSFKHEHALPEFNTTERVSL
jgi:hypothetical protein